MHRFHVINAAGTVVFTSAILLSCVAVAQAMHLDGEEAGIEEWAGDGRWEPVCRYALDAAADHRTAI